MAIQGLIVLLSVGKFKINKRKEVLHATQMYPMQLATVSAQNETGSGPHSTGSCETLGLGSSRAAGKHGLTPIFHQLPSIHHSPYSRRVHLL